MNRLNVSINSSYCVFNFNINPHYLALGLNEYLKKVWVNVKVENKMRSVDADIEKIHELWDEEETTHRMNVIAQNGNDGLHYSQEPSEVKGLDNFEIRNNMIEED